MKKRFIGFDLGAESGRCIVAELADEKIELHEVHRFTTHNIKCDQGFHWDILAIYEEILTGLTNACKNFGPDFDGIGVDTWGVDYALINNDGRVLGYPYHYRDDRTDDMMEYAFKIVSKKDIYGQVGIQFAQFNTLFQLLAENKNKPNLLEVTDKMLLIPDFLNYMLSGSKKAEYTIASTTSLADPKTRQWSWELIEKFGLPKNVFPEMVEPGCRLGNLLPSLAKISGLKQAVPVYASAGHDTASAVVSVPASGKNWAYLSSGTWSLMGVEISSPVLGENSMKYNFTNEGGVEGTTRLLKNILGLWPIQECKRYWADKGEDYSYPQLADFAKEYGFAEAWVDLNDPRFLKAGEMPEKIIAYLNETGQKHNDDKGFIIRTVLESLAFSYRKTIKEIEEVTGNKIEVLHAVGGGIQNELLTQFTADAIGRKVIAGPVEGTIVGNIGVQAVASGAVPNLEAWRKVVSNSFDPKIFEPANAEYFDKNESRFNKILK